ncbi:porin [Janthinobacterium aestuarii]
MRHCSTFALLFAASGTCLAQSGAVLYGIADAGIRYGKGLNAANAPTPGGTTPAVSSGINNTSRWGLRGHEDLGGGWQALYRLEGGLNLDTGSAAKSDKLFDRQAWVGLKSPLGSVTLGRQATLLADAIAPVDPLGIRYASFNPNVNITGLSNTAFGRHSFGQQYGSSGYADNFYRLDNMVKASASLGPVVARAAYSFGEVAGATSPLSTWGGALTYQQAGLAVSGAAMRFRNRDNRSLDAATVGAAYKVDAWQFKANLGVNRADVGAGKSVRQSVISAGVSRQMAPDVLLTTAYYKVRRSATGHVDDGFQRAFAYLEKTLSPRSTLYLESDYTTWQGDAAGVTGTRANDRKGMGLTLGLMHKF